MLQSKSDARILLERRFAEGRPGDVLLPVELKQICGLAFGDSRTDGYRTASQASTWVESHHGVCWRYQRDTHAWHCLKDDEKVGDCDRRRKLITRRARRNKRIINTIDFANLTPAEQAKAAANFIVASAIETLSHGRTIRKIETHAERGFIPSKQMLIDVCKAKRQ